jgi:general secretion pathway protein C
MTTATLKPSANSWTLRLFTLLIWLLVGLCAAYWAFKFATTKTVEATTTQSTPTVVVDSKAVGRLLGATDTIAVKAVNTLSSTKFVLFGMANSVRGQGYALIALDGKPARPYRVGSMVADNLLLKSSSLKSPDGVTLELPERKAANNLNLSNSTNAAPVQAPNVAAGLASRFPQLSANNANNANSAPVVIPSPIVQPSTIAPGAAATAAISRFAPRTSSDGSAPAMPSPAMPGVSTGSTAGER